MDGTWTYPESDEGNDDEARAGGVSNTYTAPTATDSNSNSNTAPATTHAEPFPATDGVAISNAEANSKSEPNATANSESDMHPVFMRKSMITHETLVKVLGGILLMVAVWWVTDVTLHMRRLERLEATFEYLHGDVKVPVVLPEKK